uniref:Uncharacterized protein n=1 Tax=Oryza rufipogon TaxID=4529 RepID=A0A0E0QVR3_ORYRU
MMMRAASSCCRRPCMLRAVLRGVTLCAGVAARATVRSVERFARRLAVGSVTGGITLSDVLVYMTMTEAEGLSPEPAAAAAAPDHLPPQLEENLVVAVLGGMVILTGAVIVGRRIADEVKNRSYWRRFDSYEYDKRTLAAGDVAAWLEACHFI